MRTKRQIVAVIGGAGAALAALLMPVANAPIIGGISWSFPPGGEFGDGLIVAVAGIIAIFIGVNNNKAQRWNVIPGGIIIIMPLVMIFQIVKAMQDIRTNLSLSGENLGAFQGIADMAAASFTLGPAAPVALLGGIAVLTSALMAISEKKKEGDS